MSEARARRCSCCLLCLAETTYAQTTPAQPSAATLSPNDYSARRVVAVPARPTGCLQRRPHDDDREGRRQLHARGMDGDPNAPIDCFYVYPTVSTDPTPFSDMTADPAELNVVRQQFARFGSVCRLFAPLYRQVTLAGLRRRLPAAVAASSLSKGPQYDDVRDAWRHYLEHDNRGRGVVLDRPLAGVVHPHRADSAGDRRQARAVAAGVGDPARCDVRRAARARMSAGRSSSIPLCRKPAQTGCVVTYVSFRSTSPPPANTRFGKVAEPGMVAACTNPAALGGGSGAAAARISPPTASMIVDTAPRRRGSCPSVRSRRRGSACPAC